MLLLTCNDFESHLIQSLSLLRQNDELTDVTLTCDVRDDADAGSYKRFRQFKAHKIVLVRIQSPTYQLVSLCCNWVTLELKRA